MTIEIKKSYKLFSLLAIVLLSGWLSQARAAMEIEITRAGQSALPIAIVPFGWSGQTEVPEDIAAVIAADLQRSGRFKALERQDLVARPVSGADVKYANWRLSGVDYLLIGKLDRLQDNTYKVQFQLLDVLRQKHMTGYNLTVQNGRLRQAAHEISDIVFEKILGEKGAFNTQIAYISAEGKADARTYRLQVADSDGHNPVAVLTSRRPLMSPAWAPDARRLAYVSFEDKKRSAIYIQDTRDGSRKKLISKVGINGAPAWSPDGKRLAAVLSHTGDPEIFIIDVASGRAAQVTKNAAIDTEPAWVDDETLVFTSDRSGSPQIYEVSASGGRANRLTFEGRYNASPAVSSDGNTLALVNGDGGQYRIAVIDRPTGLMSVLTDGSLDESPSFAPNGSMILYASESAGRGVLGAVSIDGNVKQRITLSEGDVREPSWSPLLQ
ncbi:MAG: Tol-Pal system beta propeller repeat protein TolB [Gammaproteobacteria bacterium]|nr:Tol-Pal system beta propeller repeat protein TolB [Gammaproteobacteria bacterium]